MSTSLLLLCVSAVAVVAFAMSVLAYPVLVALRPRRLGLTPRAEARMLFVLALLPAIVSVSVVAASLTVATNSGTHHCIGGVDPHEHPHLCLDHHHGQLPGALSLVLGGYLLLRLAVGTLQVSRNYHVARRLKRSFMATTVRRRGLRVLPFVEPQAFLLGSIRPELFVTKGLLGPHAQHLKAVLAHERAHIQHRDPALRAVAKVALAFHLPFIARQLDRALAISQEMAADSEAAAKLGSFEPVARALLQLTRANLPPVAVATSFACSNVEQRISRLLERAPAVDAPSSRSLLLFALLGLAGVFVAAEPVHHTVEMVMGAIGN